MTENNRLTHERLSGFRSAGEPKYWTGANKPQLVERLAAYEDTGLTPQEIISAAGRAKPVRPERSGHGIAWYFCCGACGKPMDPGDAYCRGCGQAVKWDG